jgi:hypothetical protein
LPLVRESVDDVVRVRGEWSAARDTIRTLFLAPPPDVQAVFDQLEGKG